MIRRPRGVAVLGLLFLRVSSAFRVGISDTDDLREVCSGMWGGDKAYIQVSFDPSSAGQVALVVYEWSDVPYLGVDSGSNGKTYICTTSAVRSGLCTSSSLGTFITSPPTGSSLNSTSIFTMALKFRPGVYEPGEESGSGGYDLPDGDDEVYTASGTRKASMSFATGVPALAPVDGTGELEETEGDDTADYDFGSDPWETPGKSDPPAYEDDTGVWGRRRRKRQITGILDGVTYGVEAGAGSGNPTADSGGGASEYTGPIEYAVKKTGYYCVGIVPVTLVDSRRDESLASRQATHAEYSGVVLFQNVFDGELPAVEYPKINFYMILSIIYFVLGCGWGFLCFRHFRELLPMQYYISGTIVFLIIEMLAQFGYYRYINKHGGGAGSLAFLFVIAILNAARNSLSFFLLLIVSMGLSVVTQSLGSVMNKVRALTAFHFIFGVLYAVGVVEVEIDNAPLPIVLLLIFPLSLTLTAFLMWIIVSLNGTILHLQQRKQRYKLQMFQRLWRILIMAVIAVAAFFVVSSMSLSSRLDEDYAPRNWRYRWILLDGSLATIYLLVFASIAYLWRPSRDNVRFAMSQELAQDEAEADAEDYEIDTLENGRHRPLNQHDDDDDDEEESRSKGYQNGQKVQEENVVFAMGDDSDEESDRERGDPPRYSPEGRVEASLRRSVGEDGDDDERQGLTGGTGRD